MQSALALGVATLGSLFLSLDAAHSLGMRTAFVAVIGVQTVMALLVAVAVRGLPRAAQAAAAEACSRPSSSRPPDRG